MSGTKEGWLIQELRQAVARGELVEPFTAKDVVNAKNISCAPSTPGTFLPKHCEENPGGDTELFFRVARGLYSLKPI